MKPAPETVTTAARQPALKLRKPSWFKRLLRACLLLLVLLVAAVLALPYALPWLLQKQGIDFAWQNPQWQLSGFRASQVQLALPRADAQPQSLHIDNLQVDWAWQAFPIQRLQAEHLQVQWPITENDLAADEPQQTLPKALLKWLPQHIELKSIDAKLSGLGHLQGSLNLQASALGKLWQPSFIHSQLTLKDLQGPWLDSIPSEYRPTQFSAQITTHPDHQDSPSGQQLLTLDVHSQGPMRVQLNGLLDLLQTPDWHGTLKNAQLFMQLDALTHPSLHAQKLQARAYFEGQADSQQFTLRFDQHSSFEAQNLRIADTANARALAVQFAGLSLQGQFNTPLTMEIQSPFNAQIKQLSATPLHSQDWALSGTLSGQLPRLELSSSLTGEHGIKLTSSIALDDNSVQGNINLHDMLFNTDNPLQKTFTDWPESVFIDGGQLHSQVDFNLPSSDPLTLNLIVSADGIQGAIDSNQLRNLDLAFSGQVDVQRTPQWHASLNNAQLSLDLAALSGPSLQTKQLRIQSKLQAEANSEHFTLRLDNNTRLDAQAIKLSDAASTEKASFKLPDLIIQGSTAAPDQADIRGSISLHLDKLSAEQLHTQDWELSGSLSGLITQPEFNGTLSGQQGLSLSSRIRLLDSAVQGRATLQEIFFKAGNPLQKTFKDWPELVSFDSGRLHSQIDFTLPYSGALKLAVNGSASGLNGIINRSELKNLGLEFKVQLSGQTLSLELPSVTIALLNPGIPLGPITLKKAHFQAQLNNILQGSGHWQSIQANLLNGRVWLDAQDLDLSRTQRLLLQVEGLELQELLKVYPAEGLAGTGIIDGQLPIHIAHNNFYIEAGQLQAREPGVLQFQSEKIQALGQSNPAMRIVADALDDFHFNLLSSGLSYDQSGKLLLNVSLKGQNPDLEKGRPIHLNINLEEDIPALLASIQLSGQVSEIIQKRVRERLEKR